MVYLFLANGFEEVEALCPLDLLRRAGVEVTTVGVGGAEMVQGSHGITVQVDMPDTLFRDAKPEMVILPGGMPGAANLDASRVVDAALRVTASANGFLAAICAAPMVLGHRGYLQGKRAICFPGFEGELTGAEIVNAPVVRDGKVITAIGMGAATAFGLALVEALCGKEAAEALRQAIHAD